MEPIGSARELELRQKLFIPGLPTVGSHFVFTKLLESLSFIKKLCIKTCFCPLPVPRQCPLPAPSQHDKDVLSRPRAFNFLGRPRAESRAPKPFLKGGKSGTQAFLAEQLILPFVARSCWLTSPYPASFVSQLRPSNLPADLAWPS